MVSSYGRIRCPVEEGMARCGGWIGLPELGPPRLVPERDAIDLASDASGPWTVIEELSGGLALRSAASWLELAQGGNLVYAGYNDAIPYAQVFMVEGGRVIWQYLQDEQDPSADVDVGGLPEEAWESFAGWSDAMGWVEADPEALERPREGWLWIHRAA